MHLATQPNMCSSTSIHPSKHSSIYQSIHVSFCSPIHPYIHLSTCSSIHIIHPFIHLSIHPSISASSSPGAVAAAVLSAPKTGHAAIARPMQAPTAAAIQVQQPLIGGLVIQNPSVPHQKMIMPTGRAVTPAMPRSSMPNVSLVTSPARWVSLSIKCVQVKGTLKVSIQYPLDKIPWAIAPRQNPWSIFPRTISPLTISPPDNILPNKISWTIAPPFWTKSGQLAHGQYPPGYDKWHLNMETK